MMDETPAQAGEIRSLRLLRILVTVLMVVMIVGFIVLIALLVTRLPLGRVQTAAPALPDTISLPDGTRPTAFTQGGDWYAVVTGDDRILIFDRASGALRQTVEIQTAE